MGHPDNLLHSTYGKNYSRVYSTETIVNLIDSITILKTSNKSEEEMKFELSYLELKK